MLRTIATLLYVGYLMIVNIPLVLYWKFSQKIGLRQKFQGPQTVVNIWARRMLRLAGVQLERSGEENIVTRPALWVGNHQGIVDTILILSELGPLKSIVAKKEVEKFPVANTWMRCFDCIFMDRGNPRETLKSIQKAQKLLENGKSVVIFPEGTRSRGPEMLPFKPGAFRCAIKAGVPVVPFVIDESYNVFEANGRFKKAKVKISILPAIETVDYPNMNTYDFSAMVQQQIQDELYRLRGGCEGERKVWTKQDYE